VDELLAYAARGAAVALVIDAVIVAGIVAFAAVETRRWWGAR